MTLADGVANVLLTAFFAGLLALVLLLWRLYRIDALRFRLLVLRDELFDYAFEHGVPVQAPAYVMLRHSINSMMRFAHKMVFTRFLLLFAASSRLQRTGMIEDFDRQWRDALDQLGDDEHRKRIADLRERALLEVSKHMALGSIPWILILSNVALLNHPWQRCRQSLLRKASIVEMEAATHSDRLQAGCRRHGWPSKLSWLSER